MKKKILAFCLLITLVCTFLLGCNLFGTNTEKDLQRVIALVGDENVYQDEIKKYELVNYYYAASQQQTSSDTDTDMESLLKQMIYRRITVQEAVNYLLVEFYKDAEISNYIKDNGFTYYEILGRSDLYDKDKIDTEFEYENYKAKKVTINIKKSAKLTIKDILSPAKDEPKSSQLLMMLLRVYYDNNKTNIIDKLEKLKKSGDEGFQIYYKDLKTSEVFSDYLTISAFNSIWESEKSALDEIENQLRKDRGMDEIVQEETSTKEKRAVPAKDKEEPFILPNANEMIGDNSLRNEAFKKYKSQIKKNFFDMSYEEFSEKQLVSELEQKLIERHQALANKNYTVDINEFAARFNIIKKNEKQTFDLSLSDYETKLKSLGDDTFILYNPAVGKYGYVKHILLGLDTDLNRDLQRELDILKARETTRDVYLLERDKILINTKVKDLREGLEVGENDDRFPGDYDLFSDDIYTMKESDGDKYFYKKFKDTFGAINHANGIYQYDNTKFTTKEAMLDKFKQWIFMYNTDPGMFNNKTDYLLGERGSMNSGETYMAEFAKASRDIIKKGIGYYTLAATDYGYHLIICSDIITTDDISFDAILDKDKFNDMVKRINEGKETSSDRASAIYKLYMVIRNEKGQNVYNESSEKAINDYYDSGKVKLFESRYKDLL